MHPHLAVRREKRRLHYQARMRSRMPYDNLNLHKQQYFFCLAWCVATCGPAHDSQPTADSLNEYGLREFLVFFHISECKGAKGHTFTFSHLSMAPRPNVRKGFFLGSFSSKFLVWWAACRGRGHTSLTHKQRRIGARQRWGFSYSVLEFSAPGRCVALRSEFSTRRGCA